MKTWFTGSTRRKTLGVSLAAVIVASVMVTKHDQDNTVSASVEAEPSLPQRNRDAAGTATSELALYRLNRNTEQQRNTNLFSRKTWRISKAKPVVALPPSKPKAPTLPFTYLGKMIDGGSTITFISRGDENYSIKTGDIIDNVYKVDRITDHSIVFTYLPLKSRQTLMIAGAQ